MSHLRADTARCRENTVPIAQRLESGDPLDQLGDLTHPLLAVDLADELRRELDIGELSLAPALDQLFQRGLYRLAVVGCGDDAGAGVAHEPGGRALRRHRRQN